MTIQELGSLGELVAAIATLATLIYLALQIRANTTAIQAESRRGATGQVIHIAGVIGENKEAASVFRRGLMEPGSLDPDESVQFLFLFSMLTSIAANIFTDYRLGIASRGEMESTTTPTRQLLRTPGGRHYWSTYAAGHTPEFREYVDDHLRESSA